MSSTGGHSIVRFRFRLAACRWASVAGFLPLAAALFSFLWPMRHAIIQHYKSYDTLLIPGDPDLQAALVGLMYVSPEAPACPHMPYL